MDGGAREAQPVYVNVSDAIRTSERNPLIIDTIAELACQRAPRNSPSSSTTDSTEQWCWWGLYPEWQELTTAMGPSNRRTHLAVELREDFVLSSRPLDRNLSRKHQHQWVAFP